MSRRPTPHPKRASLSAHEMSRGIERLRRQIVELEALNPTSVQKRSSPDVKILQIAIDDTLSLIFGRGTVQYNQYAGAANLDSAPSVASSRPNLLEVRQYLTEDKARSLALLKQAMKELEDEFAKSFSKL